MEAVDNNPREHDVRRILNILGAESQQSGAPKEVLLESLEQEIGSNISNEIVELAGSGIASISEKDGDKVVSLTDEGYEEMSKYGFEVKNLNLQSHDLIDEHVEDIDSEDMPDWILNISEPQRYVAAITPFGRALNILHNPNLKYNAGEVENFTGIDLEEELEDLVNWGYLNHYTSEEIGLDQDRGTLYELNFEDSEVRGDASLAMQYIEDRYHGNVGRFLDEHSESDRKALEKMGIRFYQNF